MSAVARLLVCFLLSGYAVRADGGTCCGSVTEAGHRLSAYLDSMDVESLWLAHEHVNWENGKPNRGPGYEGPSKGTHCSAFAAAAAKHLGIYMLRPPEHPQDLLASAQTRWFATREGRDAGWRRVAGNSEAQRLANEGQLVVVAFENPDQHKPGHIAIIRPSGKSSFELRESGPQVIQAGQHNHNSTTVKLGFRSHPGAWPDGIHYYAHAIQWKP